MINLMEKENILIQMEQDMKENGKMISKMGMGKKFGLMEHHMKDNIKMEKKVAKGNLNGQMVPLMKEILKIII